MNMSENIHRLEGSNSSVGGLVIRKKKSNEDEDKFAAPAQLAQKSLLGLDRLAAIKEKEKAIAKELEQFKEKSKSFKKYRRSNETPSYTGGVNPDAQKRRDDRRERERERGVRVSNDRKDRRDWREDRRDDRKRDHRKSDRRDHRRDWDVETPRSKRNHDDNDDLVTPYMKSKDTPSQMPWDDEDHSTPGKFSSWDLPTPGSSRRENEDGDWNRYCETFCQFDFHFVR